MKMRILAILAAIVAASTTFAAIDGSDSASGTWTNGGGETAAFSAWSIVVNNGTGGAGSFIGDPSAASISGMSSTSLGLYANPNSSGASVDAGRTFNGALSVGQTFSFVWGINYDSGFDGAKGFHITYGGIGGTDVVVVNNAGNSDITLNNNNIGFGYGTVAMTWSFTMLDETTLRVQANDRDGSGSLDQNVTVASAPDAFRFYAYQMQFPTGGTQQENEEARDRAQPYINNLQIVPEPSTMVMAVMGALGLAVARRRLQK